eukprot:gene11343-5431_t
MSARGGGGGAAAAAGGGGAVDFTPRHAPLGPKAHLLSAEDTALLEEFFEVAIHHLLYVRNVYPPSLFERRKKYGVPVQMSRHPELNSYILSVLESITPWMQKGIVRQLALVVSNASRKPIERFIFEVDPLGRWEEKRSPEVNSSTIFLTENPDGCTFVVMAHTTDAPGRPPDDWEATEAANLDDPKLIPLKSSNLGFARMQIMVVEAQNKDGELNSD